jgi:DNA mismatch repair protein MutS2
VDQIFAAIGDAQDLSKGLSSFSAHIAALKAILEEAKPGSLILIDEMASDTDPREGSALGISVLEELLARGALVVAGDVRGGPVAHGDARVREPR